MGAQLQSCGKICSREQPSRQFIIPGSKPATDNSAFENAKKSKLETYIPKAEATTTSDANDWEGRVKATPILDEGFICMGSKAPLCPPPPKPKREGPITLDVLQGAWVGSSGSQISVLGTAVSLNSVPLKAHSVELWDDGTVRSIGKLWQLEGWGEDGCIAWRASSTQENMMSARSETWTQKSQLANSSAWSEKMQLLGYAGSAAQPLNRGIEGCCPGTLGAEMPVGFNAQKDMEECGLLTALIDQWREPEISNVRPCHVVPDATNREQTGLGIELCHYIAIQIKEKGFKKRQGKTGHDIPVVVRQPVNSEFNDDSLEHWKEIVELDDGFPPVRIGDNEEFFSSLGNGHFFQALNLYDCGLACINNSALRYTVGSDALLSEALNEGVPSIVLRTNTPKPVRAKVAKLLNSKRDFHWSLDENGKVDTTSMHSREDDKVSQFEWLSKGMDAHQVNCLVRTHLGIKDSHRIQG